MKITFSGCDFFSRSGPNSFAKRLRDQFILMGHDIVSPNENHDIWLCFIQPTSYPCKGAKTILRLDGIWSSPKTFHNNQPLKEIYDYVDQVVIQTKYDHKFITKFFGERKNISIIGNGIDLDINNKLFDKDPNTLSFVCSASWHGQKRLIENIRLLQHIRKNHKKECYLTVLGDNFEHEIKNIDKKYLENIYFAGNRTHEECMIHYRTADWMIHLAFGDHFPNSVCEALSQLCPVIYASDGGGTLEVVKNNGIVVQSSKNIDFELCDYENPEKEGYVLDIDSFLLPEIRPTVDPSHLDIKLIAQKYIEVFEK